VQINADRQQAAVRSTEANRAGVEADVSYWRQQVERLESLLEAGAISRQEFDQAQNTLRTAEARLGALDAQLSEGRVQLQYHRVDAPQAGIVGDIAVRVGDRVTTSTVITTIDESAGFEAYIQVPLDRAPDLRPGLPVHLLDTDGQIVATNPISFIAPRVDDGTQTVLVKSALAEVPAALRVRQFVRARLVWRSEPGLTIPVTAVTRVSGQHFCYVAEPSRRRPRRPSAARSARRDRRQRLRRAVGALARRTPGGRGHSEDRQRHAGARGVGGWSTPSSGAPSSPRSARW
jgi:RND family efflux transporter MFP subunit